MINTRKRTILSAFLILITTAALHGGSLIISEDETTTNPTQAIDLTLPSLETKPYKSRMRKKNKKAKKEKRIRTYMDMDYDELVKAKNVHVANNNTTSAIKYVEQLMKLCGDVTKLADHLLELGDLFFNDGQFQKASLLYIEYSNLYPGSDKMEYALYQAIQSSFACVLPNDRDQTKTEETIGLTEIFLIQDHFATHRENVKQIQTQCYEKLAASECSVCSFYVTRDRFASAEKRLKKIRATWLPKLPNLESEIILLEAQLTEKKEAAELLRLKNTNAAAHKELLAQNKKPKRMTDRF